MGVVYSPTTMKRIRIIKRKQNEDANATTEAHKPDEPSNSKIVHTVKNWIAESQQRKRSQRRTLTASRAERYKVGEQMARMRGTTLPAGKYELTIQPRLACCDGPMMESNKINFEVVP